MTRADQETAVLSALRETHGYFTIFWATETQYRALALERLESRGEIVTEKLAFPLMRAWLKEVCNV